MDQSLSFTDITVLQSPYTILGIHSDLPKPEIMNAFVHAVKQGKNIRDLTGARKALVTTGYRLLIDLFYTPPLNDYHDEEERDVIVMHQKCQTSFRAVQQSILTENPVTGWAELFHEAIAYGVGLAWCFDYINRFTDHRLIVYQESAFTGSAQELGESIIDFFKAYLTELRQYFLTENQTQIVKIDWLTLVLETECASARIIHETRLHQPVMGWKLATISNLNQHFYHLLQTRALTSAETAVFFDRELFGPYAPLAFCLKEDRFLKALDLVNQINPTANSEASFKLLKGITYCESAMTLSVSESLAAAMDNWRIGLELLAHTAFWPQYVLAFKDLVKQNLKGMEDSPEKPILSVCPLIETAIEISVNDPELMEIYIQLMNQFACRHMQNDLAAAYQLYNRIFQYGERCRKVADNIVYLGFVYGLALFGAGEVNRGHEVVQNCLKLFPENFSLRFVAKWQRKPDEVEFAAYGVINTRLLYDLLTPEELSGVKPYERQGVTDPQLLNSIVLAQKRFYCLAKEALKRVKTTVERSELEDEVYEEMAAKIIAGFEASEYSFIQYQQKCFQEAALL